MTNELFKNVDVTEGKSKIDDEAMECVAGGDWLNVLAKITQYIPGVGGKVAMVADFADHQSFCDWAWKNGVYTGSGGYPD